MNKYGSLVYCFIITGFVSISNAFISGKMIVPKVEHLADHSERYFRQILDHFNSTETKYWQQRYFMKDQYWGGGDSPIFLMVGGEDAIQPWLMGSGMWVLWAHKYKALLVQLEHRFYGQSRPVEVPTSENLFKYLSSEQALADVAYFIEKTSKKLSLSQANKWIAFGGSYPGALATWARLKYPQLVYGTVASSAPVQPLFDFYQYNEVVRNSLNSFYPGCADHVTKAIKTVQTWLKSDQGLQKLDSKIKICEGFDVNKQNDVSKLILSLSSHIERAVQYNKQDHGNSIDVVCHYMTDESINHPLDRLAQYLKSQNLTCARGNYEKTVSKNRLNIWSDYRHWIFQTCNEFGYFQTSNDKSSFLSDTIPAQYFVDFCSDTFSTRFTTNNIIKNINTSSGYFGGLDMKVDRILSILGSVDPWHPLGMIPRPTNLEPVILINGTSHCYDMWSPRKDDPRSLTAARDIADRYLQQWLTFK